MNPADMQRIKNGYAYSPQCGTVVRFSHIKKEDADDLLRDREDQSYIVETINWTVGNEEVALRGGPVEVHYNRYFAYDLMVALAIATRIGLLTAGGIAEDLVRIRPATAKEFEIFFKVQEHYEDKEHKLESDGLSEKAAKELK